MADIDPSRVIQKLALNYADTAIKLAMTQVALEDAEQRLAQTRPADFDTAPAADGT